MNTDANGDGSEENTSVVESSRQNQVLDNKMLWLAAYWLPLFLLRGS